MNNYKKNFKVSNDSKTINKIKNIRPSKNQYEYKKNQSK